MPANVVKTPRDERLWNKAKALAEKQGKAENYAYIMGIYQSMKGEKSMEKSWSTATAWRDLRIPGVPGQGGKDLFRLLDMPKPTKALAMLDHTEPSFSHESVVAGLGLSKADESDWRSWMSRNITGAQNEVVVRKNLYERFIEQRTPPELRKAIFQRALNYFGFLHKSEGTMVEVVTPDELLEKAEPRGGTYYRRVPKEDGKGHRYFYTPEDYEKQQGAHIDGEGALKKRLHKKILEHVTNAGPEGCDHVSLQHLAAKHGADKVAAVLREATAETGPLMFQKGKFMLRQAPVQNAAPATQAAPAAPVQKSLRFIVTR